jgi:hypothetical protein
MTSEFDRRTTGEGDLDRRFRAVRSDDARDQDWDDVSRRADETSTRSSLRSAARRRSRPWRPFHLRWGLVVAGALLVGSGFGFSLGSRDTSSGSATTNVVGFGFLPAKGWTVVQSGKPDRSGATRALAANVPLHPADEAGEVPYATLESLPAHGILISTTFTTRGDPTEDMRFPDRKLPLRLVGAKPVSTSSNALAFPRRVAEYRLRAAVGGYNVDARAYFGTVPDGEAMALAQRQLSRLVVASERVTIAARPSIVPASQRVTVFGSVESGQAGELVTVEAKECGATPAFFRDVASATTNEGGGWSTDYMPRINTTLRAVWKGTASEQVVVRQRAIVSLVRLPSRRFRVQVGGRAQFWRKRVQIQRFERRLGTWKIVRSVVLTESGGYPGSGESVSWAEFRARIPRGSLIRAALPRSAARPCYVAGYSKLLQT